MRTRAGAMLSALLAMGACRRGGSVEGRATPDDGGSDALYPDVSASDAGESPAPPDATPFDAVSGEVEAGAAERRLGLRCPKEMVNVGDRFCIDRYEDSLVDDATGERLSPHYPPEPGVPLKIWN